MAKSAGEVGVRAFDQKDYLFVAVSAGDCLCLPAFCLFLFRLIFFFFSFFLAGGISASGGGGGGGGKTTFLVQQLVVKVITALKGTNSMQRHSSGYVNAL